MTALADDSVLLPHNWVAKVYIETIDDLFASGGGRILSHEG